MHKFLRVFVASSALLFASSAAFATVGTITCSGAQSQVTFNVSYYKIGIDVPGDHDFDRDGWQSPNRIVLHAPIAQFETLFAAATSGAKFGTCALATNPGDGTTITYSFKLKCIRSVHAVGHDSVPPAIVADASFLEVKFEYENLTVSVTGGGRT